MTKTTKTTARKPAKPAARTASTRSTRSTSREDRTYDAIVIGGGHNGLVNGAYLAKAGLRTLILERRHLVGGAESSSGLIARHTISMSWAYWLYASASCLLCRAISLRFSPWSWPSHR